MKGSENQRSSKCSDRDILEGRWITLFQRDSIKEILLRKGFRYFKRIDDERFREPFHLSSEISLPEDLEQRQNPFPKGFNERDFIKK